VYVVGRKYMKAKILLSGLFLFVAQVVAVERPHIILIMVDDMGFADLGYHGSEIDTPNIDALAHGGVRFSQFYNSGRCCPTRATLMTGLHPHQVGIGHMTQSPGSNRGAGKPPAYQGYLNRNCVTLAEVLKPAGYATLMAGKWHLGHNAEDRWPLQRGFEKYFGCIAGATRFFHPQHPRGMTLMNENVEPESTTDEAFYTTDAFTDYAIRFLKEEQSGRKRPSFLYLAYTAPHWPLQAFEDDIAKYRGKYRAGWEKLREQRYKKQIELGLVNEDWPLSPATSRIPAWDTLDEKKQDEMDLKMAVYAAMIDRVDQNIGKLVAYLKSSGMFDNTLIMFLSDNGACQEGGMLGRGNFYDIEKRNQETANSYGEAWANAGNTPFRMYKHHVHEGGSATPFFMHWPKVIAKQKDWYREPGQLIDLVPTIIDVAGATYPVRYEGNDIPALDGMSMRSAFTGRPLDRGKPFFVEHENNAFMRDGDWKLVGLDVAAAKGVQYDRWELYNIRKDRSEVNNLAEKHPERVKNMAAAWDAWAKRVGVYPKAAPRSGKKNSVEPSDAVEDPDPPQIVGRGFKVRASIQAAKPHGVVVSHGGVQWGYSLHLMDGKPAFELRQSGRQVQLRSDQRVSGKAKIEAELNAGEMLLRVDGKVIARQKSPGLFKGQPAIGLYRGLDFKDPVGSYKAPNRFNGKILKSSVELLAP